VAVEEALAADAERPAPPDEWACIVTYLNQTADQTERCSREVSFRVDGNVAICHAPIDAGSGVADNSCGPRVTVRVDFATGVVELEGKR
jgi:hypothetical protein